MIVRNWMKPNPLTVSGAALVSEAKGLLLDNNLNTLPVVDHGKLRGLVTRHNMMRMGHYVMRTQNPEEFNFFVNRLKVRDIMVRNPATVEVNDTMEHCLSYGKERMVAQFPVLEADQVVGMISAKEIFQLAAHCVGAWERRNGVTLAAIRLTPGVLGRIADVAEAAGAILQAIYPIAMDDTKADDGYPEKTVILRFRAPDYGAVLAALESAGFFPISERI
jgi:acetoin utilization protein AcuB